MIKEIHTDRYIDYTYIHKKTRGEKKKNLRIYTKLKEVYIPLGYETAKEK